MSTTPRLLSAIFASATGSAVLVQNGDRITAALQRLFAQPNDSANAVLQKVLERIDQRPQTVVVREGGGAGRVVLAGACVAGLAVRLRGWPASAAALRAAAQTLNGAVKAVGARLEVVRETLSKRVDEVGEKVDDVGVEVGEVKAELARRKNEFEIGDYFKQGYIRFIDNMGLHSRQMDIEKAMKLAEDNDFNNKQQVRDFLRR